MGTHYRGTEQEVRALNAYIKLMRAAESVAARVSEHLPRAGITLCQFGVLEALYHLGPLSHHELCRKLLRSGGNITTVVRNLMQRGLVRQRRSTSDRRVVIVELTAKGRRVIARLFPRHVAAIVREMSALTAQEQEELGRLCRKLGLREGENLSLS